nr:MAG TPA: hypothetical protein [Ackermannviridae sp.]
MHRSYKTLLNHFYEILKCTYISQRQRKHYHIVQC